ncbi:MAG: hypothetical protein WAM39_22850 [Bryobacteraceae bacterium]
MGPEKGERVISCTVNSFKDGRLQIMAPEAIPSGAAVSVEHEDALLLGEVLVSAPKPHAWHIEIRVEQVLNGLMNLMALRARLLREMPAPSPVEAPVRSEK